jgi:hypothetical protein
VSNSSRLLEELSLQDPKESNGNTVNLGADDPEMGLGITWRPATDILGFESGLQISTIPVSAFAQALNI